jgi:putative transposase
MDGSIGLKEQERKTLLKIVRRGSNPEQRLRAHILLLLDDGHSWSVIETVLFTSSSTINRWRRRCEQDGIEAVRTPARPTFLVWWVALVVQWVTSKTPRDFGFFRSRWSCAVIVLLLREDYQVSTSVETIRRWLHRQQLVWRRPRPVLGPVDPQRAKKLREIRELLAGLPADEVAVFEDEVDINTNPKIGSMWMRCGQQAQVVTPGNNTKRYLAGSLNWRTGELIANEGTKRNAQLFLAHLDELRRRLRCYRRIHVVCDNARFHNCQAVWEYLHGWGHRIVLHFLPTYAPETNPIERVWWHLHEDITRNHRCQDIEELLDQVFEWLTDQKPFRIETSLYRNQAAA